MLDLTLTQPADRAGQEAGDLGPDGGGDLGSPREQEVAGEDRLQVAPFGIDRLDAAPRVGLVDDVVVVERAEVHELAGHTAADRIVGSRLTGELGRCDGNDRAQPLAAGDDEMRSDLRQVRVGAAYRFVDRQLDTLTIRVHRWQREQGGPHRSVGHDPGG